MSDDISLCTITIDRTLPSKLPWKLPRKAQNSFKKISFIKNVEYKEIGKNTKNRDFCQYAKCSYSPY